MKTQSNQNFNGIISPASWGRDNQVKKVTLYTEDGEDILLEHRGGIEKLIPFVNKHVRIRGQIVSDDREGRKVLVKRLDEDDHRGYEEDFFSSALPAA